MKLDQKYFVPFMAIVGMVTLVIIIYSSFSFKERQKEDFIAYTLAYDSLLTLPHPYISSQSDSLKIEVFTGKKRMIVFWASWSEKSELMMNEISEVSRLNPDFKVIAALVNDVTDNVEGGLPHYNFEYIDGTILFNKIRVPGIPSYILLDEDGNLVSNHVGYQEGSTKEELINFLQ